MKTKTITLQNSELLDLAKQIAVNGYEVLKGVKINLEQETVILFIESYEQEYNELQGVLARIIELKALYEKETDVIGKVSIYNELQALIKQYEELKQKINLPDLHVLV